MPKSRKSDPNQTALSRSRGQPGTYSHDGEVCVVGCRRSNRVEVDKTRFSVTIEGFHLAAASNDHGTGCTSGAEESADGPHATSRKMSVDAGNTLIGGNRADFDDERRRGSLSVDAPPRTIRDKISGPKAQMSYKARLVSMLADTSRLGTSGLRSSWLRSSGPTQPTSLVSAHRSCSSSSSSVHTLRRSVEPQPLPPPVRASVGRQINTIVEEDGWAEKSTPAEWTSSKADARCRHTLGAYRLPAKRVHNILSEFRRSWTKTSV